MDVGLQFLPRRKPWLKDRRIWIMQRYGQEVRSQTEYILGTDRRLFQDVDVRDTHHHLDHYMVLGYLRGDPAKELTGYIRKARRSPLRTLCHNLASAENKLFSEINTYISMPPLCKLVRRDWISDNN